MVDIGLADLEVPSVFNKVLNGLRHCKAFDFGDGLGYNFRGNKASNTRKSFIPNKMFISPEKTLLRPRKRFKVPSAIIAQ